MTRCSNTGTKPALSTSRYTTQSPCASGWLALRRPDARSVYSQKRWRMASAPERMTLQRLLGDVALSRGEYTAAITHYEACLAADDYEVQARILALDGLGKVATPSRATTRLPSASPNRRSRLARDHGDQAGTARALVTLGDAAFQQGDYPTAQTHFSEGLRLFRKLESPAGVVGGLNRLGQIATLKGDKTTARTYLEESLNLSRQMGDRQQLGSILNNLGNLWLDQGNSQATRAYYESSLRLRREIGDRNGVGGSLAAISPFSWFGRARPTKA